MTKKKHNHITQIGQQLFSDFMSLPKTERTTLLKQVAGESRTMKYLYALAQQPEPLWEYVCGILPYDDAVEIATMKQVIERSRFCQLMDTIDEETLNDEEGRVWDDVVDEMNAGTFNFNMAEVLRQFHVPEHLIDTCFVDYDEVYREILTNDDEFDTEMYHNILKRLKPEYIHKINQLKKTAHLIVGMLFENGETDLSTLSVPHQKNTTPEDKLINQLYFIDGIIGYLHNQNISNPVLHKCEYYWERMTKAIFVQISQQLQQLPTHKEFPEIGKKLKQTGMVFSEFFPEVKENDLEMYYNLLLDYTRRSLCLVARNKQHEHKLMCWFSQQMGIQNETVTLTSEQQKEDEETGKLMSAAAFLEKIMFGNKEEKQETIQSYPDLTDIIQKFVDYHDITNIRLTEEVIQTLRESSNTQPKDEVVKKRSLFRFMQEHELLYIMGIFNQEEFHACHECIVQRKQNSTLRSAKIPVKITDIYNDLFNQPGDWKELPLKKEYIETMQLIRQASDLYHQLYKVNAVKVNLLSDLTFLMSTEKTDSPLKKEGIFLYNMILLSKTLISPDYITPQLAQLVDSYWNECVSQLTALTPYRNRTDIINQIHENLSCFDASPTLVQNGFSERRQTHQYILADIDELICLKHPHPHVRNTALSTRQKYTYLFEEQLNTTIDEQINMAFNRHIQQRQNIHE